MDNARWTDSFLDELKGVGDKAADETLEKMIRDGEVKHAAELFKFLDANNAKPVHDAYPAFTDFYDQTNRLPEGTDLERIERGENFFIFNSLPAALVLLGKSLPEGYSAPNFTEILGLSKNLELHPYHRLLKVMQMLINVGAFRGFKPDGRAVISAQKLRLLHAGIRIITKEHRPDYSKKFGTPINLEDMLATLMGFSLLLITGLRLLGIEVSDAEADDYFYVWRIYALLMGIHPPDKPHSFEYIPDNVQDAQIFYEKYAKRHYVSADQNPHGLRLEKANIDMMKKMIPGWSKVLGFGLAPKVYTQHLIGREACSRVGIKPLKGFHFYKWLLYGLPKVWLKIYSIFRSKHHYHTKHHYVGQIIFQKLINNKFGHIVEFEIPLSIKDMLKMG